MDQLTVLKYQSIFKERIINKVIINTIKESSSFIQSIFTSFNIYKSFLFHRLLLKDYKNIENSNLTKEDRSLLLKYITDSKIYEEIKDHFSKAPLKKNSLPK